MRFEPLTQLPNAWTMVCQRFGVHLFEGDLDVDEMTRMEARATAWHARNPGRIVELVVIYPSDNRMSSEERSKMTQLIKKWEHVRDASATVILAEGLVGSLQRSILTGLMMLAPAPHPARVFGKVPPAVSYLTPYISALCSDATEQTIIDAVAELSSAFEARTNRR